MMRSSSRFLSAQWSGVYAAFGASNDLVALRVRVGISERHAVCLSPRSRSGLRGCSFLSPGPRFGETPAPSPRSESSVTGVPPPHHLTRDRAFTLLELLIATAVGAVVLIVVQTRSEERRVRKDSRDRLSP